MECFFFDGMFKCMCLCMYVCVGVYVCLCMYVCVGVC